jgi:hypothetical protein
MKKLTEILSFRYRNMVFDTVFSKNPMFQICSLDFIFLKNILLTPYNMSEILKAENYPPIKI